MMEPETAKRELARVAEVYPSVREYVQRNAGGPTGANQTYARWFAMLGACDEADVVAVVDEIISGDREPWGQFEKPDALPRNIASEAKRRRFERNERARQFSDYHAGMGAARNRCPRFRKSAKAAIVLGEMVRDRKLSSSENTIRMQVVSEYFSGGPEPGWEGILEPDQKEKQNA